MTAWYWCRQGTEWFPSTDPDKGWDEIGPKLSAPNHRELTDDELHALIKPLWLETRPSREAQSIRSGISVAFDDPTFMQWPADFIPEYVWDLVDIAAQQGIDLHFFKNVTHQKCAHCGISFKSGPGTGRRDGSKFCSDQHRKRFNSLKRSQK